MCIIRVRHNSVNNTTTEIRSDYYVPKLREFVRSLIHKLIRNTNVKRINILHRTPQSRLKSK